MSISKNFLIVLSVLFLQSNIYAQLSQPDCSVVQINNIMELTIPGENYIYFVANMNAVYPITMSSFTVEYQDGTRRNFNGTINTQGDPAVKIPVTCNNKVTNIEVYVWTNNCIPEKIKTYHPGICTSSY